VVEAAPLIKQFLKTVDKVCNDRFDQGQPIPGLKQVHGQGRRKWIKSEDEVADALRRMGVPKAHIYPPTLISPAQTDKLAWEKGKRGSDQKTKHTLTDRQKAKLAEELIGKSTGSKMVVPEADPRPAIAVTATEVFAEVKPVEAPAAPALPSFLQ